jgi:hypothetical protein
MTNHEGIKREDENPWHRMSDEFTAFVGDGGYAADEVNEAYERLMDVAEAGLPTERVASLIAEMDRLKRSRYPITRFVELINAMRKLEVAVPAYYAYVDALPITEREKVTLKRIVERRRKGTVSLYVGDCVVATFDSLGDDEDQDVLAMELVGWLKVATAQHPATQREKYGFTFSD